MTPKPIHATKKETKERKRKNAESIENSTNKRNKDNVSIESADQELPSISEDDDDDISLLLPTRFAHLRTIEAAIDEHLPILVEVWLNSLYDYFYVFIGSGWMWKNANCSRNRAKTQSTVSAAILNYSDERADRRKGLTQKYYLCLI